MTCALAIVSNYERRARLPPNRPTVQRGLSPKDYTKTIEARVEVTTDSELSTDPPALLTFGPSKTDWSMFSLVPVGTA